MQSILDNERAVLRLPACVQRAAQRGIFAVAIAASLWSVAAVAQTPTAEMPLPALAHDRGVRTGEFTLYPSFAVMGHYDSNLFNGNNQEPGNPPKGATSLRLMPKLSLSNDASSNVSLLFNALGDARIYFGGDNAAINQQQNVGGTAGLEIVGGQRRTFSFTFYDYFNRALRANNWETVQTFNRVSNDVGGRIDFHPGDIPERRPFNVGFSAGFAVDSFDDYTSFDTKTVKTRLTGSWRFLPKTAAILDSTWDFRNYDTNELASRNLAHSSKPFRAKVGLSGMMTKRISAQALAGWGLSSHSGGSEFNNYVANVGIGMRASESTRLYFGYDHDFVDSYLANFADTHRFSASLRQRFGQVMDVSAAFGVRLMNYGNLQGIVGNDAILGGLHKCGSGNSGACRNDKALDGSLVANFEVARLVSMSVGYTLRSLITDFKISQNVGNQAGKILDVGAYTGHEIYASLVLRY